MKKTISVAFMIMVMAMVCVSCEKTGKNGLVGSWDMSYTAYFDDAPILMNGLQTFNADGTYSVVMEGSYDGELDLGEGAVSLKMKMNMTQTGNWSVDEKNLVLSPSSTDITKYRYYDPDTDELILTVSGAQLDEVKKYLEENGFMQIMNDATTERIILQQKDKVVTENEEDGETITTTYTRVTDSMHEAELKGKYAM